MTMTQAFITAKLALASLILSFNLVGCQTQAPQATSDPTPDLASPSAGASQADEPPPTKADSAETSVEKTESSTPTAGGVTTEAVKNNKPSEAAQSDQAAQSDKAAQSNEQTAAPRLVVTPPPFEVVPPEAKAAAATIKNLPLPAALPPDNGAN